MTTLLKYAYQNRFDRLLSRAAKQADVMVPVLAGPTLIDNKYWAQHIIRKEWRTKIASVIITKQDLIADPDDLPIPVVIRVCEVPGRECILLCDTPKGMAATQLELHLDELDRKYASDPISPRATANTDPRLGEAMTEVMAELRNKSGSLYRVGSPKHQ